MIRFSHRSFISSLEKAMIKSQFTLFVTHYKTNPVRLVARSTAKVCTAFCKFPTDSSEGAKGIWLLCDSGYCSQRNSQQPLILRSLLVCWTGAPRSAKHTATGCLSLWRSWVWLNNSHFPKSASTSLLTTLKNLIQTPCKCYHWTLINQPRR